MGFGKEMKLNSASVPVRREEGRFISETVPPMLYTIPVQLHRYLKLVRDQ